MPVPVNLPDSLIGLHKLKFNWIFNDCMNRNLYWVRKNHISLFFWGLLLLLSNSFLLTPDGSLPRLGGALLLLLLPGLVWGESIGLGKLSSTGWLVSLGLSYSLVIIGGLGLYYLGGKISTTAILLWLNGLILLALIKIWVSQKNGMLVRLSFLWSPFYTCILYKVNFFYGILIAILLLGAVFRFINLGYSEFQGDETLVMTLAAETLEGQPNALFSENNKGPGQILLPMMLWRLTGVTAEAAARFPFALAGFFSIVIIYLLGRALLDEMTGLFAAVFFGSTGLMIALSRIVQYQQIVVFMSGLSLLCAWQWRQHGGKRWAILTGLFLGTGFLFHYDAIMVAPAVFYVMISKPQSKMAAIKSLLIIGGSLVVVAGFFFVPYLLSPQAVHTGGYLGKRIGQELLKNKLDNFFHVTTLYNSSYYVVTTGLLVITFFTQALSSLLRVNRLYLVRYVISLAIVALALGLSTWPNALLLAGVNLAFIPFAVIFLAAFLSPKISDGQRTIVVWMATVFSAYNFAIVDPGTHIYTILPPWLLLVGQTVAWGWMDYTSRRDYKHYVMVGCGVLLVSLFSGYNYIAFLRQDVEFKTGWPDTQPSLYWNPYNKLPQPDHSFGFVHKEGWKAVGGLYLTHHLQGEYQTNGKYGSADWYTRHKSRGCYDQSKQFLALKNTVIDPIAFADYKIAGEINLPYERGMTIYQIPPLAANLLSLPANDLQKKFDATAFPEAFVRPARNQYPATGNLYGVVKLIGAEIIVPKAKLGETLAVTLYWQSLKSVSVDLHVFVHLTDETEKANIWGQSNGSPACGQHPTSTWQPGQVVKDTHIIFIDPNLPPSQYRLSTGMYLPGDNIRLPLVDEKGVPTTENTIELTTINIE
jgi:4-amino-4-deoxy-L-arabinose transferase-like glycosyltransferase